MLSKSFDGLLELLSNQLRSFVMPRSMIEDRVVTVVLNPGVWGFVEFEMAEDTVDCSEFSIEYFPEEVNASLGGWIDVKAGAEVLMIPPIIKLTLDD